MKHRFLALILFFSAVFSAGATVTAHYYIDATGIISENAVASKYDIPSERKYDNYISLKREAEFFKQQLINSRIFKSVNLEYKETSPDNWDVSIFIKHSATLLVLPYPKYDSNEGLSLKLKAKDMNFLGSLGEMDLTVDFVQQTEGDDNNTFDFTSTSIDVSFDLDDLRIGETIVNTSIDAQLDFGSEDWKENSEISGSVSLAEMDLGSSKFSSALEFKGDFSGFKQSSLGFLIGFKEVPVGDFILFHFNPYFFVAPQDVDSEVVEKGSVMPQKIGVQKYGFESGVNYGKFGLDFSFFDFLMKNEEEEFKEPHFGFAFKAYYDILPWLEPSVSLTMNRRPDSDFLKDITLKEDVDFIFSDYRFSVGEFNTVDFEDNTTSVGFTASAFVEKDNVNYVLDDFRKGFYYKAQLDGQISLFSDLSDKSDSKDNYLRAKGEFIWFPFAVKMFNPSFRVNLSVSDRHLGVFRPESLIEDDKYNGYGFDFTNTSGVTYLGEYMRGIRNNDSKSVAVYNNNFAAVFNFDFKFVSDSTFSFVKFYLTPFIDAAVLFDFESKSKEIFCSAGFDSEMILAGMPAYPIRISLGCDLKKLKAMFDSRTGNSDFFELYIGLHHFY